LRRPKIVTLTKFALRDGRASSNVVFVIGAEDLVNVVIGGAAYAKAVVPALAELEEIVYVDVYVGEWTSKRTSFEDWELIRH